MVRFSDEISAAIVFAFRYVIHIFVSDAGNGARVAADFPSLLFRLSSELAVNGCRRAAVANSDALVVMGAGLPFGG